MVHVRGTFMDLLSSIGILQGLGLVRTSYEDPETLFNFEASLLQLVGGEDPWPRRSPRAVTSCIARARSCEPLQRPKPSTPLKP